GPRCPISPASTQPITSRAMKLTISGWMRMPLARTSSPVAPSALSHNPPSALYHSQPNRKATTAPTPIATGFMPANAIYSPRRRLGCRLDRARERGHERAVDRRPKPVGAAQPLDGHAVSWLAGVAHQNGDLVVSRIDGLAGQQPAVDLDPAGARHDVGVVAAA